MGSAYRDDMPFTILDVLDNLKLPVKKEQGGRLILDCPFCFGKDGRPDRHGHLEVNLERDRFRCHRCGRMGGKLELYMEGHPNVSDTKQAYREMMEYLEGSRPSGPSRFTARQIELPPSVETSRQASPEDLHRTYANLLSMLSLTSTHRQNLRDRGLPDEEINRLEYRSVPTVGQRKLAADLLRRGCVLEGVPGFYLDERERWTLFTWKSGIMMPERDLLGRIHGLQVRKDQAAKSKCYWITGSDRKLGAPHNCIVHFSRPEAARNSGVAYLTEGIMKADIASHLSDRCFLAVPGVSHYSAVQRAIPTLWEAGIHTVMMAFDMDLYENPAVQECFKRIQGILREAGFQVKQITWDRSLKGIDDYLQSQFLSKNSRKDG